MERNIRVKHRVLRLQNNKQKTNKCASHLFHHYEKQKKPDTHYVIKKYKLRIEYNILLVFVLILYNYCVINLKVLEREIYSTETLGKNKDIQRTPQFKKLQKMPHAKSINKKFWHFKSYFKEEKEFSRLLYYMD